MRRGVTDNVRHGDLSISIGGLGDFGPMKFLLLIDNGQITSRFCGTPSPLNRNILTRQQCIVNNLTNLGDIGSRYEVSSRQYPDRRNCRLRSEEHTSEL